MAGSRQTLLGALRIALWLAAIACLFALSQYNVLLFRTSVELLSFVAALGAFAIAWNAREYLGNGYLSLVGLSCLFVATLDVARVLAYEGTNVIPGGGTNLATQLWLAARYVQSVTLLVAPAFTRRRLRVPLTLATYGGIVGLVVLTVLAWRIFPTCYIDGVGFTAFKTASDYAIAAALVAASVLLLRKRREFDSRAMRWLVAALGVMLGAEGVSAFSPGASSVPYASSLILKLASFVLMCRALIEAGVRRPFERIFRRLKESEAELEMTNEKLELRVAERTERLSQANAKLREEAEVRQAVERRLQRQNFVLKAIRNVNQLIVREREASNLIDESCTTLVEGSGYSTAWITLRDEKQRLLASSHRSSGAGFPRIAGLFSDDGLPPCAFHAWERRGVVPLNPDVEPCVACPTARSCDQARMTACLVHDGTRYGVLGVTSTGGLATREEELDLIEEVAKDIAFALHDIHLEEEKERSAHALRGILQGTIQAVAETAASRDPYIAEHQRRVTRLSLAIGRELGLDDERLEALHTAALLHDIGKVAVPAEILSKPSRLTSAEAALMQAHPRRAYDILKYIEFPWPIAEFVLQHHERLDGSGYPKGLAGDRIHLESRILAVADTVEAMSSHRPYRASLGIDAALAEINENSPRLYDARVVSACSGLFAEARFRFTDSE
jgi:putative nucleotidyltransferase with HDIG domain